MLTLSTPIEKLKHVGSKMLPRLKRLHIHTVKDLLWHFPHRYEDYSRFTTVRDIPVKESVSIRGVIRDIKTIRTWKRRMTITNALLEDDTGSIEITWFNQPYLSTYVKNGYTLALSGKTAVKGRRLYLQNPSYEIIARGPASETDTDINVEPEEELIHTGRLVPVYPQTEGITSRYLRTLTRSVIPLADSLIEYLPGDIMERHKLLPIRKTVKTIHFPKNADEAEQARHRLSFEELFLLQLRSLQAKKKLTAARAYAVPFDQPLIKQCVDSLPFSLTDAQRRALWEIINDIGRPRPMNRLLNGDVGSGKTVVALTAALQAVHQNYTAILLAPTEVLATQHFSTAVRFFKTHSISIGLLTGSTRMIADKNGIRSVKKSEFISALNNGSLAFTVGTHALIQDPVKPPNLAFLIVDEQHRFGVKQRAALLKKNAEAIPHLLSMTATPIPRTLALTMYGDLDISLLDELPQGRKKIITTVVKPPGRASAYAFIRERVKNGEQVFVICPRIDPSLRQSTTQQDAAGHASHESFIQQSLSFSRDELLKSEVKAVRSEFEKLDKKIFPDLRIAMLHGRLKPREKEEIMRRFKEKKYDILVSTSVVEVGVDIPDATVMMIEGAEKFGLAQLHQFRGRVGRSNKQSYCFLFVESADIQSTRGLSAMERHASGFKLAEIDLKTRGPGEFLGKEQSGMPDLAMASLNDMELIKKAREEALAVMGTGLSNYPPLQRRLKAFEDTVHME